MTGRARETGDLQALEESITSAYREEGLSPGVVESFHRFLALFFAGQGRDLPWRRTTDPYEILVSEFMLQQTQVERVAVKYPAFLGRFPDAGALARVELPEVLRAWQGLGYNRRALALHRTARIIEGEFHGEVPLDRDTLDALPGIGSATAAAVVVFSTNRPEVFIETNIRRVFIHLFFPDAEKVHDREILPLLEETLDREEPRRFYYALMDLGTALKKRARNPNLRSASYARQSPFEGSDRQLRGAVLRRLLSEGEVTRDSLADAAGPVPERLERVLGGLERDGFIRRDGERIRCRSGREGDL
jgi:A/G-specific adenine glycosylase